MNLSLMTENENENYFLIKDFNKFMLNQSNDEHGKRFVHIVCSV